MDQNNQPQLNTETPPPAPQLPTEPEPPTQAFAPQPAPKRRRKGLWAIIIAASFVVLAGGVVAGYFLWYQNPEKVVVDGLVNAIKAKSVTYAGEMSVRPDENSSFRLELSGKNKISANEMNAKVTIVDAGKEIVLDGSAMTIGSDLYLRFNNGDWAVEDFWPIEQKASELRTAVDMFVSKVNDQWIKLDSRDMAFFSPVYSDRQRCLADVYQRIESNDTIMSEVASLYKQHKFVVVAESLGTKDGSMGYRLELDENKLKDFSRLAEDTELYKQLRECDDNIDITRSVETTINDDDTRTEVWVGQWSHEITKVHLESTDQTESVAVLELMPKFNEVITVQAPESFLTLEDLTIEIQSLFEAYERDAEGNSVEGLLSLLLS